MTDPTSFVAPAGGPAPEAVEPPPAIAAPPGAAAPPAAAPPAGSFAAAAADGALPVLPRAPGEPAIALRVLIEAGVHFGHQTRRWNPKMRHHIYGARGGIHIIDLDQTVELFGRAYDFIVGAVARGGHVLFVGTKRQAQDIVIEEAKRCGMYHVTNRWLGGTLTNFRTIKQGLERLRSLERMKEDGELEQRPKKEIVRLEKERERLEKFLGGLKGMGTLPAAVFVVDPGQEQIAVAEARKLAIPVIAITDTNCDPDLIDFVVPGNDDAIRSIRILTQRVADACLDGQQRRKAEPATDQSAAARGALDQAPFPATRYRSAER
ncbi:MAG: 30S ribosomal protein S2 [Deltaproteobacteria bacterium]|nr:30S ribosomal protein S2 [Deltaproteobacteria bacterium]